MQESRVCVSEKDRKRKEREIQKKKGEITFGF